ncbi:MAG: hypothetical protein M1818_007484 [Claussenomyces sp. TS43310]|nr:MAG: hypothetical protein M1818_007484 [Claussenomyces sp. TS43310]
MSASSSAASASVSRSRTAIVILTAVAAAYSVYYLQSSTRSAAGDASVAPPVTGLHRSNAIHRRNRRVRTSDDEEARDGAQADDGGHAEAEEIPDITIQPLGDAETVVDETDQGQSSWQVANTRQRNGQNIVQLLFRVSEDATRRNAYIHRGCMCNSCGDLIRGIRYRCSNCLDYDLCETCEALDRHTKTHIFYKIRVPTTSYASRQTQPVWYPGDPDSSPAPSHPPKDLLIRLSKETGFERPELDAYWEQWTFMANTEWREDPDDLKIAMDRKTFDECLVPSGSSKHSPPNLIFDRMFAFYDANNDNLISFPEYLNGLAFRKKKDKLKKVFEGYDIDGDGFVERKDFLRIFRCYYVLQKERQRDMLESMDDRVMNSKWAQKLVEGRQPLSSAFGHDGNFESGPNPRRMEGKTQQPGGELEVMDGKGVISESNNDFGSKDDVIIDAVSIKNQLRVTSLDVTEQDEYWQLMLNPPTTIADLNGELLERLIEHRRAADRHPRPQEGTSSEANAMSGESEDALPSSARELPTSSMSIAHAEAAQGNSTSSESMIELMPAGPGHEAHQRFLSDETQQQERFVNSQIHERWKRRQFYTDEEEGSSAPADWNEDEDVARPTNGSVDHQNSALPLYQTLSPRSRSSSKVRFAEDTDDYDLRSNPSTSSRSIPERWGGMEIPDAERDAGKEILYQVAQQAFNELIDPIFKSTEDRAIAAMSNSKARIDLRHLLVNEDFVRWAQAVEHAKWDIVDSKEAPASGTGHFPAWTETPAIREVELEDVRQHPLEHLLSAAGFRLVEDSATIVDHSSPDRRTSEPELDSADGGADSDHQTATDLPEAIGETAAALEQPAIGMEPSPYIEENVPVEEASTELHAAMSNENTSEPEVPTKTSGDVSSTYRDPTLPQFRPNTASSIPLIMPGSVTQSESLHHRRSSPPQQGSWIAIMPDGTGSSHSTAKPREPGATGLPNGPIKDEEPHNTPKRKGARGMTSGASALKKSTLSQMELNGMDKGILAEFHSHDWMDLYDLYQSELCELEAKMRNGWGRLTWTEFEPVVKEKEKETRERTGFMGESSGKGMDYLGSWIEFCIP